MNEINHPQGTQEWLNARMGKITGSIVGEIMPGARGGKPSTYKKLLYKKAVEFLAGVSESTPIPQRYADWGHEWEAVACQWASEYCKDWVFDWPVKFRECGLIVSEYDELIASSLDRISECGNIAMEVKCPYFMSSHIKHIKERPVVNLMSGSQEKNYYWQPRHHMLATGAESCIWATYQPHFKEKMLHVEVIERDEEEIELLKNTCLEFVSDLKELCKEIVK